jgi:hypothetical protein
LPGRWIGFQQRTEIEQLNPLPAVLQQLDCQALAIGGQAQAQRHWIAGQRQLMQPAGNPVNNHGQALITALH